MKPGKVLFDPSLRGKLLTARQLGAALSVCAATVNGWHRSGVAGLRLACQYVGARRRYSIEEYERWQSDVEQRLLPPKVELLRTQKKRHNDAMKKLRARGMKV